MKVICDLEADNVDPEKVENIWVIVCREIETEKVHVFTPDNFGSFVDFVPKVSLWVGHNFLSYDLVVLCKLLHVDISPLDVLDTLVVSRLVSYSIPGGHSLEAWGERLGYPKDTFSDFSKYSLELEKRCIQDTKVNLELYKFLYRHLTSPEWSKSILVEHYMSIILQDTYKNGFKFDYKRAKELYESLKDTLRELDHQLSIVFPPKPRLVRGINPRRTKHGTLHRQDFRWMGDNPILDGFAPDCPFSLVEWEPFNPGSPSQIVERLNEAGWKPYEPTKSGKSWRISENNLETLPDTAPEAARSLVKRLMLASRVRRLEEWFACVRPTSSLSEDFYIHGKIHHIGAWTHRCSHTNPNMGNVPSLDSKYNSKELKEIAHDLGVQMRSFWGCEPWESLVGTDADSIQLRIFAHYVNDDTFTQALCSGRKEDGTDPHSLNAGVLESSRANAKTFLYAFLLNCGVAKTALIFGCDNDEAQEKRKKFIARYPGLEYVREELIPRDIANGYFVGFDGRKVAIPKDEGNMIGYVLGGYLQNGEACIMKHANVLWRTRLVSDGIYFKQRNFVHDEWQTSCFPEEATRVGETQAKSITDIGIQFGLRCPMAGNYKVGRNWYETH